MSGPASTSVSYHSPSDVPLASVDSLLDALRPSYTSAEQQHVFSFVPQLTPEQKQTLYFDLYQIQVEKLKGDYDGVLKQEEAAKHASPARITPFLNTTSLSSASSQQQRDWETTGLDAIVQGKVAVLLMAGGQGTRLGSNEPKGCYDINLLSHKSLFQLQAERIVRLRQLAAQHGKVDLEKVHIKWYVMTSIITHAPTVSFFTSHSNFGLPSSDIFFFQQSELPALSNEGKIMMERKDKVALAPNGNGGIFEGLQRRGALEDMRKSGIQYIHIYGVDNVLARVGDPVFLGFSISSKSDCTNKVVLKTEPTEKVGVMCLRDGKPSVVEYSELPKEMSELRNEKNELLYSAGNIVQHFFTREFLEAQVNTPLIYHIARKAIPYVDPSTGETLTPKQPSGLKMEMFVFDAFERSQSMRCLAVKRDEEFSPVKNAPGAGVVDSPVTARLAVAKYHVGLLKQAGANVVEQQKNGGEDCFCEISPIVSYAGEGLEALVKGKTITLPFQLDEKTSKSL